MERFVGDGPVENLQDTANQEAVVAEIHGFKPLNEMSGAERDAWVFQTRSDKASPLNNERHPHHAQFIKRVSEIYNLKYPKQTEEQIEAERRALHEEGQKKLAAFEEKAAERALRYAQEELKGRWGSNYEKNVRLARAVVERFTSPEDQVFLEKTGLGSDPEFVMLVHKLGSIIEQRESKSRKGRR